MFIVFEGIDRSGKSTQCSRLYNELVKRGCHVKLIRYPDRNSPHTGKLINDYLAKNVDMPLTAASLLLAANLWEMRDMLNKELAADNIVLMDRYFWSHIAYSAARGMDEKASAMIGMGLPVPDLTVFLDADPEVVAQRGGYGLERFEKIDFQRHVSSAMRKLAQKFPDSTTRIDAHQEIELVTTQILLHLKI